MSRNLCLAGMMGAGKTSVGRVVAERLGRRLVDTDAELARWTGRPVGELLTTEGERAFRDLEHQVVAELARVSDLVIALGGGVLLRADNAEALRTTGAVVLLDAPPPVLAARLADEAAERPLLAGARGDALASRLAALADERADSYRTGSHARVDATGTPEEVADRVIAWAVDALDVLTPSEHEQVAA